MDKWEQLDLIETTLDFTDLELTDEELELLDNADPSLVDMVEEELARYTPLDTPYFVRDAIVYKSIAQILKNEKSIKRAIRLGYDNA